MSEIQEITLGHETFRVAEMPFGKVKKLLPLIGSLGNSDPMRMSNEQFDALSQILVLGLSEEHPDLTAARIDSLPIKMPQIMKAISTITNAAGLVQDQDAGNVQPGTDQPSMT